MEDERLGLWSDNVIAPVLNEQGEVEQLAIVALDITQRKQAEKALQQAHAELEQRVRERTADLEAANAALRASEARFSSAFKHAPMMVVLAELESGRLVNVNDEFVRVSGFSREEALGHTSAELGWVPLDVRQAHTVSLSRAGRLAGVEILCRRKDGVELVCLCNAEVINIDGVPHLLSLAQDISDRKRAEEALRRIREDLEDRVQQRTEELRAANAALRESEERLQQLSRRLVRSQELERQHIARELHDQIGQSLTAVEINLQTVLQTHQAGETRQRLQDCLSLVDALVQQTQNLSLNLRPALLDDLGLEPALRWLLEQQVARAGLAPTLRAEPLPSRLAPEIEIACFRVAQEALTNVVRHAKARHVTVELRVAGDQLELTVEDDGCGFDVVARRRTPDGTPVDLGLAGMRERATLAGGSFEIASSAGRGTTVRGWLPLLWRIPAP
jgi:PAS domain S-box-containing protein